MNPIRKFEEYLMTNFITTIQPMIDAIAQAHPGLDTDQVTQIVTDKLTPVQAEADATAQRATDLETAVTEIVQKLQAGDTAGALATATAAAPTTTDTTGGTNTVPSGTDTTTGANS